MSTQIQNFYEATITRNWTSTTGDFNVSVAPSISEGIIVISPSSRTLREIVRFTATGTNAYGPYVRISNIAHRGLGGTTAQSHTIGEKIRMNITAEHWTEMQTEIDEIVAQGSPDATTSVKGISKMPIIETTSGTTHSLATVASQQVIVFAKGHYTGTSSDANILLNYNGVEKDKVVIDSSSTGDNVPFSLMYTETPGLATQDITVTSSAGSVNDVKIIVIKIQYN